MANTLFKTLKKPIFLILLLALVLRLWGITYGFPLFLVNDETPLVYGALKMIELKTLVPAFHQAEFSKVLYYPPLPSYVFLVLLTPVIGVNWFFSGMPPLSEYKLMLALDPSFIWITARFFIALLGVIDVAIIYFFTRRIFSSKRAGIFAALFLALSFYHIQLSHNVRHWLPAAFLLTLTWFLSVPIFEGRTSWKRYLGIGALVGAAAGGVNTAAIVGLIPPFFASIFRFGAVGIKRLEIKKLMLLFFVFVVAAFLFVVLHPFGFTRAEGAENPGADVVGRFLFLSQKNIIGLISFWGTYAAALWNFETPLFLTGFFGIGLYLWRRMRFWAFTALIYVFSFFTLLYLFDDYTVRGIIFVIPLLAVFAGYAADAVWEKIRNFPPKADPLRAEEIKKLNPRVFSFLVSILFFVVLFSWQLITDFRYDWLLSRDDTRLVAMKWIDGHVSAGNKIVIDAQYLRITNTKDGIRNLAEIDSAALRATDIALLALPDSQYPSPAYYAINLNFISLDKRTALFQKNFFRKNGFRYVVVEYVSFDKVSEDTKQLLSGAKLIQRFSQWKNPRNQAFDGSGKIGHLSFAELLQMERFGLFVDVYEL
ncbi:MAG: hypothetical protein Q7S66_05480 [bacterium]|nr:hypothetical protein [bacterium]